MTKCFAPQEPKQAFEHGKHGFLLAYRFVYHLTFTKIINFCSMYHQDIFLKSIGQLILVRC